MLTATTCLLGIAATIVCLTACWRMRATTLAAPCAWAAAALLLVTCGVGSAAFSRDPSHAAAAHVNFLAGVTTLAPFVALLGAKRPQNRGWQLIVASLVALLAFQDFRGWSVDPTVLPSPHTSWRWLIAALVLMQLLNYLPTCFSAAACLAFSGQVFLFAAHLPLLSGRFPDLSPLGLGLVSIAAMLAALMSQRRAGENDYWECAWLEFRDQYGALRALRVAERVNAIAAQQRSPLRLHWGGFRRAPGANEPFGEAAPEPQEDPIHKALKAILARFKGGERESAS